MAHEPSDSLIRNTKESYGESYREHLFEQYAHYVESAEKISERRVTTNNYLLTVNASLVTLYGLVAASRYSTFWTMLVPTAGILVSWTWHRIITSYRDLNTVKYEVIHELEKQMPAAIYDYEWKLAEKGKGKAYHPSSHLERVIPIIFVLMYLAILIAGILGLIPQVKHLFGTT